MLILIKYHLLWKKLTCNFIYGADMAIFGHFRPFLAILGPPSKVVHPWVQRNFLKHQNVAPLKVWTVHNNFWSYPTLIFDFGAF
jgi:hypothetical protein